MIPLTESAALESFIIYSGILSLKVLFMSILTGKQRYGKKVFANEEDARGKPGAKVKFDDPDVERVRRAHRNDLENIPAFWVLGALYLTTGPSAATAVWLFRLFTAARLVHTVFHAITPAPLPRSMAYGLCNFINWYMGVMVIWYYRTAL